MEGGQFEEDADIARRCKKLHGFVLWFQEQFSALEKVGGRRRFICILFYCTWKQGCTVVVLTDF